MEERPARLVLQQFWWSQKHPRQVAAGGDVNSSSGTNPLPLRHTPLPLTLFTMASLDRLPLLQAQCRSYPGPLSAAVYLPLLVQAGAGAGTEADAGAQHPQGSDPAAAGRPTGAAAGAAAAAAAAGGAVRPELAAAIQQLQALFSALESEPGACGLLLGLYSEATSDPAMAALMPTNALRNAALLAAGGAGPLVAMVDVDLGASAGLARLVADQRRLPALLSRALHGRGLLVLPAWEPDRSLSRRLGDQLADRALAGDKGVLKRLWLGGPGNATGLGAGAGKGQCRGVADVPAGADADAAIAAGCPDLMVPFDVKSFAAGHRATDFLRSLDAGPGEDYPIEYESGFEPWFICARELMLPYDERFRGWYGDKITQVRAMAAARRRFWVSADAWLVHRPHPPAPARALFRNEGGRSNVTVQGVAALEQVVRPRLLRRTKFQAYVTHSKNMDFWQRRGLVLGGWRPTLSAATQRCWQQLPWWRRHKHEGRH
ncbi:hypothetical protein CHLRE_18g748897v5 [Chlamydomonas reinhardtii]|uniref:Uncharacterized protein n=1 Tax=Chlamydomonas reinhardtii TaxID=3055 RepID=A0A2K3CNI8_CHLRE|nr:uncharacterized protein CHLRE_18g748897v5 [Chlamydomonas reinhardtii]PNW69843.1 hypothetical protein CHLRE_18g748897v5 [Chlamydomonas reinhardtii]